MTQNVGLIYPYYENPEMLSRHLAEWACYPSAIKRRLRIVIVDDGSPRHPAAPIVEDAKLDFVQVYRIVPNIPWNQDGARNLAMTVVNAEWVLMADMDHLLPADDAAGMIEFADKGALSGRYYMPEQRTTAGDALHPHPNIYLWRRSDFWAMGGYDEDFAGAYGSDGNFRRCARAAGMVESAVAGWGMVVYRTEDCFDANTKDWSRKEGPYYRANFPKLEAKRSGPPYKATNPLRFEWHRVI